MFFYFKQKMTHLYKFINASRTDSTEEIKKKIDKKEKQINQKGKQMKSSEQSKKILEESKNLLAKSKEVLLDYHKRRYYDFFQESFFPRTTLFFPSFHNSFEENPQKGNYSSIVTKTSYEKLGEQPARLIVERTENNNGKKKTQKKSYIIQNGKKKIIPSKLKS